MHINQHAIVEEDFVECKRKRHSDDHNKEPISSIESIAEDEIIDRVGNQAQNVVCLDEGGVVVKWDETTPVENIPLEETHEETPSERAASTLEGGINSDSKDSEGSEGVQNAKRRSIYARRIDKKKLRALRKWMRKINDRLELKEKIEADPAAYLDNNHLECPPHMKRKVEIPMTIDDDYLVDLEDDDERRMNWTEVHEWVRGQLDFDATDVVYGGPGAKLKRYGI